MPGQWLVTQVENRRSLALQSASQTPTIDLPKSNYLGALRGRLRATHATAITITLNRIRVQGNGSVLLWDTEGGQARAIAKFETGRAPRDNGAGGATHELDFFLPFGRGRRDEDVILPAKAFRTLQLQLDVSTDATPTAFTVDVEAEEWVSSDAIASKRVKRISLIGQEAMGANEVFRQKLNTANLLRAVYVHSDDVDNISGQPLRLLVNGGSEVPFTMRGDALAEWNRETYRFGDDTLPAPAANEELLKIDFDVLEDLAHVIDASALDSLVLEITAAGSGTAGDVAVIVEEILALAGA